jgi:hypothetical protein
MDSQIPQAGHSLAPKRWGRNGNHKDLQRKKEQGYYVSTQ